MPAEPPPPPTPDELNRLLRDTHPSTATPGPKALPPTPPAAPGFVLAAPHLLHALTNITSDEQGWIADCPICTCEGMTVRPDEDERIWVFSCDDGCTHEEVVIWLKCDVRLYPDQEDEQTTRAWMCLMLAPTVETYEALIQGDPVAEHVLDPKWLARFKAAGVLNLL